MQIIEIKEAVINLVHKHKLDIRKSEYAMLLSSLVTELDREYDKVMEELDQQDNTSSPYKQ
jgi:hypothetical protein